MDLVDRGRQAVSEMTFLAEGIGARGIGGPDRKYEASNRLDGDGADLVLALDAGAGIRSSSICEL